MKKTVFTGSGVALVTPMNQKGVDFDALGALLDFHINNSTDAIIVCATTGEAPTLEDDEHLAVIEYAVKKVNGKIPVIAGTGSNYTAHGVMMSKKAEALGADALLTVSPYYNKANTMGLINNFREYSKCVDIPIILYNVPSRTGVKISLDVLDGLCDCENIVGIKEASGDVAFSAKIISKFKDRYDVYSGNDDITVPIMSLGGKGTVSVLANILPKETHKMCEYCLNGDFINGGRMQVELNDIINSLFCEVNPIPVKTALNLMGLNAGLLRLPLYEMTNENKQRLIASMKNIGIKIR